MRRFVNGPSRGYATRIVWQQYQKTLIPTQIAIIALCAFLYFTHRVTAGGAIIVLLVMQVANVIGAWWANRLRRKIMNNPERLPLE